MIDQPKIIAQSIQQLQYIWKKKIKCQNGMDIVGLIIFFL